MGSFVMTNDDLATLKKEAEQALIELISMADTCEDEGKCTLADINNAQQSIKAYIARLEGIIAEHPLDQAPRTFTEIK